MLEDPHLHYAAKLLGDLFLAYVTNADPIDIHDRVDGERASLDGDSERSLIGTLELAIQWVPLPAPDPPPLEPDGGFPDGTPTNRMRRFGWVDMDAEQSWANIVRTSVGADLPGLPPDLDAAELAIAEAARDFFPVTLIPLERPELPFSHHPSVSQARRAAFAEAVEADGSISRLVDAQTGYWTSASGIGYGERPAPSRVLDLVIATAEQHVRFFHEFDAESFISASVRYLNIVRELSEFERASVPAIVGFANAALPADLAVVGPRGGRLRRARETDLRLPDSDAASMVLETTCQLRVAVSDEPPPLDFVGMPELYQDADFVAVSALLATRHHEERALPCYAWAKVLDPLSPYTGWLQPQRRAKSAVEINEEGAADLAVWLERLEKNYHPSIKVALKRTISAYAERSRPEDSLVDLVIALESLFGGQGELRMRISTALAWLLAPDADGRAAIQRDAKKAYDARSKLVHGEELVGDEVLEHQRHAESLVLGSLERLLTSRTDLLPNRERSIPLILGQ